MSGLDPLRPITQAEREAHRPFRSTLFGETTTTVTTEAPPWIPPACYPFVIEWWPAGALGGDVDGLAPLHVVKVERPGDVELPTAQAWARSVCIRVVFADGTTEWVGP